MKRKHVTMSTSGPRSALRTGLTRTGLTFSPRWFAAATPLVLALTLLSGPGCKSEPQVDPHFEAVTAYKKALEGALQKNEELSRQFVELVSSAQGKLDPDQASQKISADVLPKLQEFQKLVGEIQSTDPAVTETHQFLTKVATLRVEGYQAVLKGFGEKNMDVFNEGQKKIRDSKIEEEEFFSRADTLFRSQGMDFQAFTAPATR